MAELPRRPGPRAVLLSALCAGAVLRLASLHDLCAQPLFQYPVLDSREYLLRAQAIVQGHLLWNEVSIHAPLYPYLLAPLLGVFNKDLQLVRVAQALVLGGGTTIAVWAIARSVSGSLAAAVSAWLAATLWPLVFHDGEILVESTVVCLNALALLALVRARGRPGQLALAGLLLGLSTITRPNAAAFVPVAALWAAWPGADETAAPTRAEHRRRQAPRPITRGATRFAAVCLGAALAVVPVLVRNHALSGAWTIQANAGLNFYIGNSPQADGTPNVQSGRPWEKLVNMARDKSITSPAAQDRFYRGEALRWWREAPGAALALYAKKLYLVWCAHETRPNLDLYYFRARSPTLALPWPGFGVLTPLAMLGAGLVLLRPRREAVLLLLYAAVYTLATAAFVVSSRYRLPVVSAAIPLAGLAAADLVERVRGRAWRGAIAAALVLALLAVAVRPVPAALLARDHADEYYNEGTVLLSQGRVRDAEAVFRAAWAERKDDGRIANNLGAILLNSDRTEEAVGWFREAVRLYPEVAGAWYNLGDALVSIGRTDEAKRAYLQSLALDPGAARARLGLGSILLREGDLAAARRELRAARALGERLSPAELEALAAGGEGSGP